MISNILRQALNIPVVVQTITWVSKTAESYWYGKNQDSVKHDVVEMWNVSNVKKTQYNLTLPDYAPFSLKHFYLAFCLYMDDTLRTRILNDKDRKMIEHWRYILPNHFNDTVILYFSRQNKWLYLAESETEWYTTKNTLLDAFEEDDNMMNDTTWNIISISKVSEDGTETDITSDYFYYLSPINSAPFCNSNHMSRVFGESEKLKLETADMNTIELQT